MQILKFEDGTEVQLFDKEERDAWYDRHAHRNDDSRSGVVESDFSIEQFQKEEQNKLDRTCL